MHWVAVGLLADSARETLRMIVDVDERGVRVDIEGSGLGKKVVQEDMEPRSTSVSVLRIRNRR